MNHINSGKVVIISDIHQNLWYANKCLEEPADYYVFLGDYFDTHKNIDNKKIFGFESVCNWANQKFYELGEKAIWLLGNHDLSYIAAYNNNFQKSRINEHYYCSGCTNKKSLKFSKYINPKWFKNLKLCCKVGDFYCVHGGFQYNHMKPFCSLGDNINNLYREWEHDKHTFMHKPWHWIWDISAYRGGDSKVSSPIWVDFHHEFVAMDELNQIVGHSASPRWNVQLIKGCQNELNFCIDCSQKMYLVWENNNLTFVNLENNARYEFHVDSIKEDGYRLERCY